MRLLTRRYGFGRTVICLLAAFGTAACQYESGGQALPPSASPPTGYEGGQAGGVTEAVYGSVKPETTAASVTEAAYANGNNEATTVPAQATSESSSAASTQAPNPSALPSSVTTAEAPSSSTRAEHKQEEEFRGGCIADTIFVIDSTSSVSKIFDRHKEYVRNVIDLLDISPDANHVAMIAYASHRKNRVRYSFADPQSKELALEKLSALPFIGGITATGAALDSALKELDKRRPNVGANVVVVTDGFSYDHVEDQAIHLHSIPNVRTFAVSVGPYRREYELVILAGDEKNVFRGFDTFRELAAKLQQCIDGQTPGVSGAGGSGKSEQGQKPREEDNYVKEENTAGVSTAKPTEAEERTNEQMVSTSHAEATNEVATSRPEPSATSEGQASAAPTQVAPSTTASEAKQHCQIDVVYVIDASGSLTARFHRQLETAISIIDAFPEDTSTTRLSVIKFAGPRKSRVVFPFSNLLSGKDLKEQIRRIRFTGGTTYINEALQKAAIELGNTTDGSARQLVIVFTDGFTADDPAKGAKALHQKGIPVLAVALDGEYPVNRHDLEVIADDKSHVFYNNDIDELKTLVNEMANEC